MSNELGEGSKVMPNIHAPVTAKSANEFTEDTEPFNLESDGYGPTGPVRAETHVEEEEQPAEEQPEEQPEEEQTAQPEVDPELMKKAQMLDWIMQNPDKFIELNKKNKEPDPDPAEALLREEKPNKALSEMGDQELIEHLIDRRIRERLAPVLPELYNDVRSLKQFKGSVENAMMRSAVNTDGTPLYPRWDELQTAMRAVQAQYPGMPVAEAYVLADRQTPSATIATAPRRQPVAQTVPRKPTPQQTRVAALTQFGRSSQVLKDGPKDLRAAVAAALDQVGMTE